jgi:hypothetical protein
MLKANAIRHWWRLHVAVTNTEVNAEANKLDDGGEDDGIILLYL